MRGVLTADGVLPPMQCMCHGAAETSMERVIHPEDGPDAKPRFGMLQVIREFVL
jgi:hypothetical protein